MTRDARSDHQVLPTSGGPVEVLIRDEADQRRPPVLYFHGGHESATVAPASELYVALGYPVLRVSRPGYGHTQVGPLSPAAFAPLVDEVRVQLGIESFTAVVGTSFGGPQAIEYAGRCPAQTTALILRGVRLRRSGVRAADGRRGRGRRRRRVGAAVVHAYRPVAE